MRKLGLVVLLASAPASADDGPTLPLGAWPSASLEDLRGMRECTLEDPPARVGAPVTCRPPVLSSPAHVSAQVGWVTGLAADGADIRGVHGLELAGQYWLTRSLGIGGRYLLGGIGTADPMASGQLGEGLVTAHLRLFTDEVSRDAIAIALGYGWAMRAPALGGDGPVGRAALTRDVGYMTGESSSVTWAWELAVERGLDARALTTVTAGVRGGFELGIREPRNLGTRATDPALRYTIDGEFRASPQVGMGATLGLGLGGGALWRTTAFWTTGHDDNGEHGLRATWAAVTGPRIVWKRFSDVAPYIDAQAGVAALPGGAMATSQRLGALAESEVGLAIHLFCQSRLDFGARVQAEIDGGVQLRTGFFILRVEHGTALQRGDVDAADCRAATPLAH